MSDHISTGMTTCLYLCLYERMAQHTYHYVWRHEGLGSSNRFIMGSMGSVSNTVLQQDWPTLASMSQIKG